MPFIHPLLWFYSALSNARYDPSTITTIKSTWDTRNSRSQTTPPAPSSHTDQAWICNGQIGQPCSYKHLEVPFVLNGTIIAQRCPNESYILKDVNLKTQQVNAPPNVLLGTSRPLQNVFVIAVYWISCVVHNDGVLVHFEMLKDVMLRVVSF